MKPFDLEKAKNGAAVCLRDGRPAKILDFKFHFPEGDMIFYKFYDDDAGSDIDLIAEVTGKCITVREEDARKYDLFMAPVYAYINVFKSEDGTRLHGGTLYPTPEDCVKRAKRTWNARPFCIARVELLEDQNVYDKVNQQEIKNL